VTEPPGLTPAQTVGPFLHLVLADPSARAALAEDAPGRVTVAGRLFDGAGAPVPDGLIETWQVDGCFTRCATDGDGNWIVYTRKPPPSRTRDGTMQAPHLLVSVFARGLLDRVVTRLYFGDEQDANETDPVLTAVEPTRRPLLVAAGSEAEGYRLDIRLQGKDESVFFEF
jgi:protocatechuate 3,4-dioxygenase alpha subunit